MHRRLGNGIPINKTAGTIGTSRIADDAITYAKMQNVSATDKVLGRSSSGSGNVEEIACTAAGRAILDDADAAAQRSTLGIGTIATQAANNVAITGGSITGITDLAIADGGTGASSVAAAQVNLQIWKMVWKTSNESTNTDTVLGTDAELKFAMSANKKYAVRGFIVFSTDPAADFKCSVTGPTIGSGQIMVRLSGQAPGASGIAFTQGVDTIDGYGTLLSPTSGVAATNLGNVEINGIVINGANAGDFGFQWAQNTSNGNPTTVYAGSWLSWIEMP